MKKRILLLTLLLVLSSNQVQTQNKVVKAVGCGLAVTQLLNYANQVNNFYKYEYSTVIPNNRCPAYDPWGRYFHPNLVQNCRAHYVTLLNNWYAQQVNYVNAWQWQIANACFATPPKPKKDGRVSQDENTGINVEQIEELQIGVDDEKSVKITIPKTAEGYKPRK